MSFGDFNAESKLSSTDSLTYFITDCYCVIDLSTDVNLAAFFFF